MRAATHNRLWNWELLLYAVVRQNNLNFSVGMRAATHNRLWNWELLLAAVVRQKQLLFQRGHVSSHPQPFV